MKPRTAVTLAAPLCALAVGFAARVAGRAGARHQLSSERIAPVDDEVRERLAQVGEELTLTYYASPPEDVPADLADVAPMAREVLESLAATSERVHARFAEAREGTDTRAWLEASGAKPFRARRVVRDGWTDAEVWSGLEIGLGARPALRFEPLLPAHVPHLSSIVLNLVDEIRSPRRPVVALASGTGGFEELARELARYAEVRRVDFDADPSLPLTADFFVWAEPRQATEPHLAALDAFTDSGRAVVLAGSRFEREPNGTLLDTTLPADILFRHYGVEARGATLDVLCEGSSDAPRPWRVRSIAPNQDFRAFAHAPNGTLLFEAPTGLEPGFSTNRDVHVLASTSSAAWTWRDPVDPDGASAPPADHLGSKVALALRLSDPGSGRGDVLLFGASTPFGDDELGRPDYAHRALVSTLVETFGSDLERALHRSGLAAVPHVAQLTRGQRAKWRLVTTLLFPGLLLFAAGARRGIARSSGVTRPLAMVSLLILGVGLAALVPGPRSDWTRIARSEWSPITLALARNAAETVRIEPCFTPYARLPAELRPRVRDLEASLAGLARQFATVEVRPLDPRDLGEAELRELGIAPVSVTTELDEERRVVRVYSALRVTQGERVDILSFPDAASFDDAELRLAARLARKPKNPPRVAFASDVPRLSPAEALLEYEQRGLFPPTEGDVFSGARRALEATGFNVVPVDPARGALPRDTDLVVWLQPRREAGPMLAALAAHLAQGGGAIVAAQHYDVVRRRVGGREAWWPRPLFPDIDEHYLPELSIELVREVLADELAGAVSTDAAESAPAPFHLRASASAFADSPFVEGLGDLAFPGGNRLRYDAERLAELGLSATPLAFTSSRAYGAPWQGGPVDLRTPSAGGPGVPAPGALLAALFEGPFPRYDAQNDELLIDAGTETGEPGRLLLIGSSRGLRDGELRAEGFRGDRLLTQAAMALVYGDDLARVAAARPASAPGFGYVAPSARAWWRVLVIAAGPLALGLARCLLNLRRPQGGSV